MDPLNRPAGQLALEKQTGRQGDFAGASDAPRRGTVASRERPAQASGAIVARLLDAPIRIDITRSVGSTRHTREEFDWLVPIRVGRMVAFAIRIPGEVPRD